jgi:hypothetical protein
MVCASRSSLYLRWMFICHSKLNKTKAKREGMLPARLLVRCLTRDRAWAACDADIGNSDMARDTAGGLTCRLCARAPWGSRRASFPGPA